MGREKAIRQNGTWLTTEETVLQSPLQADEWRNEYREREKILCTFRKWSKTHRRWMCAMGISMIHVAINSMISKVQRQMTVSCVCAPTNPSCQMKMNNIIDGVRPLLDCRSDATVMEYRQFGLFFRRWEKKKRMEEVVSRPLVPAVVLNPLACCLDCGEKSMGAASVSAHSPSVKVKAFLSLLYSAVVVTPECHRLWRSASIRRDYFMMGRCFYCDSITFYLFFIGIAHMPLFGA